MLLQPLLEISCNINEISFIYVCYCFVISINNIILFCRHNKVHLSFYVPLAKNLWVPSQETEVVTVLVRSILPIHLLVAHCYTGISFNRPLPFTYSWQEIWIYDPIQTFTDFFADCFDEDC